MTISDFGLTVLSALTVHIRIVFSFLALAESASASCWPCSLNRLHCKHFLVRIWILRLEVCILCTMRKFGTVSIMFTWIFVDLYHTSHLKGKNTSSSTLFIPLKSFGCTQSIWIIFVLHPTTYYNGKTVITLLGSLSSPPCTKDTSRNNREIDNWSHFSFRDMKRSSINSNQLKLDFLSHFRGEVDIRSIGNSCGGTLMRGVRMEAIPKKGGCHQGNYEWTMQIADGGEAISCYLCILPYLDSALCSNSRAFLLATQERAKVQMGIWAHKGNE